MKGICDVSDLYKNQCFVSFQDLSELYGLTDKGDFCKFLQLRSTVSSTFGLEWMLLLDVRMFKNFPIVIILCTQPRCCTEKMCESLRLIWQKDLGDDISEDVWQM